jgi:phosphohistidine swiveling domain-containing protein
MTGMTATDDAFPVTWADPADAERPWRRDDMHSPFCLPPLSWDYGAVIGQGFGYAYQRIGAPIEMRVGVFNGYLYFAYEVHGPGSDEPAMLEAYRLAKQACVPDTAAYWARAVPELQALYAGIAGVAVDELAGPDLAVAWEDAWARAERAWQIHFYVVIGPYQVLDDLADLYESVMDEASPGEALQLIHGTIDELIAVEAAIAGLTARVAASPALAAAIADGVLPSDADLATIAGGSDFGRDLDAFLAEHGHLGQGFDDLALASWAEAPEVVLREIARRLERPVEPIDARTARLVAQADLLADAVRVRLADRPDTLAEFERVLAHARAIGRITETHNYWIDRMVQARLRTLAMRVGARLAREGVLDQADDILFLRRDEIARLVRRPVDQRRVVAERRAEHVRWQQVRPPAALGHGEVGEAGGRFGGVRYAREDDLVVRGTGASAGQVTGPARVVVGPDDFARVRPGDIIVAPSSNPSWVPLFAIAGGVITNTGGVLSHAAVVAREFGLPAVVGTGDATTRIVDGRTVELDGSSGYVHLR